MSIIADLVEHYINLSVMKKLIHTKPFLESYMHAYIH
jgi:hypothetical protein